MAEFFDRVRQGVDRGILTVSVRSREFVDNVKVKNQITEIRRKKRIALEELGDTVYKMYQSGGNFDEEKIQTKCEFITGLDGRIRGHEEELSLIRLRAEEALNQPLALQKPKPAAVCECGAEVYEEGVEFCGKCSRKIEYKKDGSSVSSEDQITGRQKDQ